MEERSRERAKEREREREREREKKRETERERSHRDREEQVSKPGSEKEYNIIVLKREEENQGERICSLRNKETMETGWQLLMATPDEVPR